MTSTKSYTMISLSLSKSRTGHRVKFINQKQVSRAFVGAPGSTTSIKMELGVLWCLLENKKIVFLWLQRAVVNFLQTPLFDIYGRLKFVTSSQVIKVGFCWVWLFLRRLAFFPPSSSSASVSVTTTMTFSTTL